MAAYWLLAVLAAPGAAAASMSFRLERSDGRPLGLDLIQIIWADGEITPDTGDELRRFAARNNLIPDAHVYLNSNGGSLGGGISLGQAIRELGFRTNIGTAGGGPGTCLSACAYAYLGGTFRYIRPNSTFGVHRFDGISDADDAQRISGLLSAYIQDMGVSGELFPLMTVSGADEILAIPHPVLLHLNVVNNGVASTAWDLGNLEEVGFYLRGTVVTDRGEHKLLFVCHDRRLFALPMLQNVDPAWVVAGTGSANWIFDGDFQPPLPPGVALPEATEGGQVTTRVPVDVETYRQILAADSIGFAWVQRNRQLYSGFEIRSSQARQQIRTFARTCSAEYP